MAQCERVDSVAPYSKGSRILILTFEGFYIWDMLQYPQDIYDLSDEGVLKVVRNSSNLFSKES